MSGVRDTPKKQPRLRLSVASAASWMVSRILTCDSLKECLLRIIVLLHGMIEYCFKLVLYQDTCSCSECDNGYLTLVFCTRNLEPWNFVEVVQVLIPRFAAWRGTRYEWVYQQCSHSAGIPTLALLHTCATGLRPPPLPSATNDSAMHSKSHTADPSRNCTTTRGLFFRFQAHASVRHLHAVPAVLT